MGSYTELGYFHLQLSVTWDTLHTLVCRGTFSQPFLLERQNFSFKSPSVYVCVAVILKVCHPFHLYGHCFGKVLNFSLLGCCSSSLIYFSASNFPLAILFFLATKVCFLEHKFDHISSLPEN